MDAESAAGFLAFLKAAAALKDTPRFSWTAAGRRESAAEHSWRLALAALALGPRFPALDIGRVVGLCLVHDLGEAISGDTPAPLQASDDGRIARERADFAEVVAPLDATARALLSSLWEEYAAGLTPEARLAKALDKIETVDQHNLGANPTGFDHGFDVAYGRSHAAAVPELAALRRLLETAAAARAAAGSGAVEAAGSAPRASGSGEGSAKTAPSVSGDG
jgi:putative hydrolase of HD superfamily